ncbi:MAG TPA: hypothetical protein VIG66_04970 [Noviherbaspirillum sp.]
MSSNSNGSNHLPSLEEKLAFLHKPGSYPDSTHKVDAIETHMSWVFLTAHHAYKLKKPLLRDEADMRSVAVRHHYCQEELRLNRRLAPDVYLDVVPLSVDWRGALHFGQGEQTVDWLVQMRRLPEQDMLDNAIRNMRVGARDIVRVAQRLAEFYALCPPAGISEPAYLAALEYQIACNEHDLLSTDFGLDENKVRALCSAQRAALQTLHEPLAARVAGGMIVEGHGDLRPEHICIRPTVVVIDCLEFSRALRLVDPVDELAFLALELERLFANGYASLLLQAYGRTSGDQVPPVLLHFYKSLRAAVRARLAIRHLAEARFRVSDECRRRADSYLELAAQYQNAISSVTDSP